jgi:tetratricopeptide (TPR) repeat protein
MSDLTLEQAVQLGLSKHQSGDFAGAERIYGQILRQTPQQPDVLNLLGVCIQQQGRSGEAERWFDEAISQRPTQGAFYTHRGMARLSLGRTVEAVADLRVGVDLDPSPEAWNDLGNGLRAARDWHEAIAAYRGAIAARPGFAEAHFNLGLIQRETGDMAAAVDCFAQTVSIRPDFPEAADFLFQSLIEAGKTARSVGDLGDATGFFGRAAELRPQEIPNLIDLATALTADDKHRDAADVYRRALAVDPDSIPLLNDLGNVLHASGQVAEALAAYGSAMELTRPGITPDAMVADVRINRANALVDAKREAEAEKELALAAVVPDRAAEAQCSIGNLRMRQRRLDDAIRQYESAISLRPDYADAMTNLGTAVEELGRRDRARSLYRQALWLKPDSISAPWNLALLNLLEGHLSEGFIGYEGRWRQKNMRPFRRSFPQPMWDGGELENKTVLLYAEQGFGDAIQFARYVPLVAERGARVVVEVPRPLVRLFESLRGAVAIVATGTTLPEFDLHCPLMSLPRVFGTTLETIPADVPYLSAPRVLAPGNRAPEGARPRIGLVWTGNPHHQRDAQRSIPPDELLPLTRVDATWIGLQIGPPSPVPGQLKLIHVGDQLTDFADTAAIIEGLDLVLTVDTAIAHLAAAMGKPVWVMLAHWPDWRWMLDRSDSPWYPTMRLFRQNTAGDWGPVVRAVVDDLVSTFEAAARS